MGYLRICKHLLVPQWRVHQFFSKAVLQAIETAISTSEKLHTGELRFVVEGGLLPGYLWRNTTPRRRAEDLFGQLRVWDTEHNSGILIYVQWIDRAVEILADRGIAARVPQAEWDDICHAMETAFSRGDYEGGSLAGIASATRLLTTHFPAMGDNPDELSNKPLVM